MSRYLLFLNVKNYNKYLILIFDLVILVKKVLYLLAFSNKYLLLKAFLAWTNNKKINKILYDHQIPNKLIKIKKCLK